MKILVTGSKGFIGKNLCLRLKEEGHEVFEFDIESSDEDLTKGIDFAEFIVHLAGINRPMDPKEFLDGNVFFTKKLLDEVQKQGKKYPILFASSTQADLDNPYGKSKKQAEQILFDFAKENGNPLYVRRFYNVFGKWCKPNYNSVIATFCNAIANDLPYEVNPNAPTIDFIYIDDLVDWIIEAIEGKKDQSDKVIYPEPHYSKTLTEIVDLLTSFKESRVNHMVPKIDDPFAKKLYSTYLTYLPIESFAYPLDMHIDQRGSFTEILKTIGNGQISVNVGKPGITKGNHYHHTKNEKYLVVHGECLIKFRKVDSTEVIAYRVSGDKLEVVDIPPGYTHNITNIGKDDSVTLMWANELFDPEHPDTYPCQVEII